MTDESYDGTEQTPVPKSLRPPPMANESLLNQSLFSFSAGDGVLDEADRSLPSLAMQPPSPINPTSSTTLEDRSARQGDLPNRHQTTTETMSTKVASVGRKQQPPMAEVRLDQNSVATDVFMDVLEDASFAQRAKHSLSQTPESKKADISLAPSTASSTAFVPGHQQPTPLEVARMQQHALQALTQLKAQLVKVNEQNKSLEQEKEILTQQLQQQELHWQSKMTNLEFEASQLQASNTTLQSQMEVLAIEKEEWTSERQELESQVRAANKDKKDYMHRKVVADNRSKELKSQLDAAENELLEAKVSQEELSTAVSLAQTQKTELETENTILGQQLAAFHASNMEEVVQQLQKEVESKGQDMERMSSMLAQATNAHAMEIQRLEAEIQAATKQHQDDKATWQADMDRLKTTLESTSPRTSRAEDGSHRFTTLDEGSQLETSIADRLARMRDAAERAQLVKTHKRDVAQLQMDHEEKIKKLGDSHMDTLRKSLKKADSNWNARLDDLKRTLQEEHEVELKAVESHHNDKFSEMQKQYMRQQEAADDSIQVALTKIATISQQCEREMARSQTLERTVEKLNLQLEEERTDLNSRHAQELEKRRSEWETERETLLTVLQEDLNSMLERRRRHGTAALASSPRPTPTNQASNPESEGAGLAVETSFGVDTALSTTQQHTPLITPSYSEFENVLRETEDLIQSIR